MPISDKYRRPRSDAAHHARRLIRAYNICSTIRYLFADDVSDSCQRDGSGVTVATRHVPFSRRILNNYTDAEYYINEAMQHTVDRLHSVL